MTDSDTLEEKVSQLLDISRLCDAKGEGIQYDEIYSNNLCFILFSVVSGIFLWVLPVPINLIGVVFTAFFSGVIVQPKLRKRFQSTNERIYASVYAYVSPLSGCIAKKHNAYLARSLKERLDEDCACIRKWIKMEIEEIEMIIYSRTRESEMREMLIEKKNNE